MKTFSVEHQADWQPVATYLFAAAEAAPLDHVGYLLLQDEKKIETATACSVLIEHESSRWISLVMTSEPGNVHLSIMQIFPQPALLADPLVCQIADSLLGSYETRTEGMVSGVHHFHRFRYTLS